MTQPTSRILIVDDERTNRELLTAMLAPEGYDLTSAGSGEAALKIVAERPPDLILLDGMMPLIDGYEVVARIKADPATSRTPILMISGSDERDSRLRMMKAQADDFLAKPVDRAELCARVRAMLHRHASPEATG